MVLSFYLYEPGEQALKRKKPTTKARRGNNEELEKIENEFQNTLLIIEGAVTGGLIAGIAPSAFLAALSYHFLICAAGTRSGSDSTFESWTTDLSIAWEPVLNAVMDFVDDFENELLDVGELEELEALREECRVRPAKLSEIEERRECDRACHVLEWVMNTLSRLDTQALIVEMAYLVVWFKVAALAGDTDDETYVIVRQYIPAVFAEYNPVLDRVVLSPV